MTKNLFCLLSLLCICSLSFAQVGTNISVDFGTTAGMFTFTPQSGSDLVNAATSGANLTNTYSFDIFDEINGSYTSPGGGNDIFVDMQIITGTDPYSGVVLDPFAGSTHDITQSTSGLRGNIPRGNSGANQSSTGDVHGYCISVRLAPHVIVTAENMTTLLTSVNTAGEAFESATVVYLDAAYTPYGSVGYRGFYSAPPTGVPSGSNPPSVNTTAYIPSGSGVYMAQDNAVIDVTTDVFNPVGTANTTPNNFDPNAMTDAGVPMGSRIGGFVFCVSLEDVAATLADGDETTTQTSFSSTLNGFDLASVLMINPFPVEMTSFEANVHPISNHVALEWETASESNNKHFVVEHSIDGDMFSSIGLVAGNGTTQEAKTYQHSHASPHMGVNYYRLKQVDFDGGFHYSDILNVTVDQSDRQVRIEPNISSSHINVILDAQELIDQTQFEVINIHGARVMAGTVYNKQAQLDISALPAGHYYLKMMDRTFDMQRFVKL